jgi:hypothetical protein
MLPAALAYRDLKDVDLGDRTRRSRRRPTGTRVRRGVFGSEASS